ncbi:MAG: hypothetical protein AAB217_14960 [Chloroflexota bacterium]
MMRFKKLVIEWRHVQVQFDVLDVDVWPTVSAGRRGCLTVMDRAPARFSCNTKNRQPRLAVLFNPQTRSAQIDTDKNDLRKSV